MMLDEHGRNPPRGWKTGCPTLALGVVTAAMLVWPANAKAECLLDKATGNLIICNSFNERACRSSAMFIDLTNPINNERYEVIEECRSAERDPNYEEDSRINGYRWVGPRRFTDLGDPAHRVRERQNPRLQ